MKKKFMILLILIILFLLYLLSWKLDFSRGQKPSWGITFSQKYAEELGLDFKKVYLDIINELKPENLRLVAYWGYLEPEKGKFNFDDLDWQIKEAEKQNKKIILAIGHRVPRWPECHQPDWTNSLNQENFQNSLLDYLKEVVNHYKSSPSIVTWQVENEPLLSVFGQCPKPDRNFLKKEIELVKTLDPTRPILVTDSGELSLWLRSSGLSEIFGTTLYRIVWNKYIGWFKHLYPPVFYTLKANFVKKFLGTKEVMIIELQAEPWGVGGRPITDIPFDQEIKHFDLKQFKSNLEFAKKTGIKQIYLWGAEWWYWRKTKGDDSFWQLAKSTF